jgi:hypothetical protein
MPTICWSKESGRPWDEKRIKSSLEKSMDKKRKEPLSNLKRKPVQPILETVYQGDLPPKKSMRVRTSSHQRTMTTLR